MIGGRRPPRLPSDALCAARACNTAGVLLPVVQGDGVGARDRARDDGHERRPALPDVGLRAEARRGGQLGRDQGSRRAPRRAALQARRVARRGGRPTHALTHSLRPADTRTHSWRRARPAALTPCGPPSPPAPRPQVRDADGYEPPEFRMPDKEQPALTGADGAAVAAARGAARRAAAASSGLGASRGPAQLGNAEPTAGAAVSPPMRPACTPPPHPHAHGSSARPSGLSAGAPWLALRLRRRCPRPPRPRRLATPPLARAPRQVPWMMSQRSRDAHEADTAAAAEKAQQATLHHNSPPPPALPRPPRAARAPCAPRPRSSTASAPLRRRHCVPPAPFVRLCSLLVPLTGT